jgi:hypothetical protein
MLGREAAGEIKLPPWEMLAGAKESPAGRATMSRVPPVTARRRAMTGSPEGPAPPVPEGEGTR